MFKPVNTDRISQAIMEQIKEAIFQKKLRIGDKLPSERKLMEQFRTSRVTVREALRTLEYSGMLQITRGVEGGAFVCHPDTKFVNNFLQDMFSMGNIKVADLTEARLAVEPYCVKIAAERINEGPLDAVRRNIEETKEALKRKDRRKARLLNLDFHRIIAQASCNPVIFFTIGSIMDIMENNVASIPLSAKPIESTLVFHEEISEAIKARDSENAQDLMLKHIQDIQKALESKQEVGAKRRRAERS